MATQTIKEKIYFKQNNKKKIDFSFIIVKQKVYASEMHQPVSNKKIVRY
jgi:hypothetical protein